MDCSTNLLEEIARRSNFSLDKSTSQSDSVSSDSSSVIDQNSPDRLVDNSAASNYYSIEFWEVACEGKTSPAIVDNHKEVNMENLVPYSEAWWKATLTAHH